MEGEDVMIVASVVALGIDGKIHVEDRRCVELNERLPPEETSRNIFLNGE